MKTGWTPRHAPAQPASQRSVGGLLQEESCKETGRGVAKGVLGENWTGSGKRCLAKKLGGPSGAFQAPPVLFLKTPQFLFKTPAGCAEMASDPSNFFS